jgi:hypothetical protein
MFDFVWDYNRLEEKDEQEYVEKIIQQANWNNKNVLGENILKRIIDGAFESQKFVRNELN